MKNTNTNTNTNTNPNPDVKNNSNNSNNNNNNNNNNNINNINNNSDKDILNPSNTLITPIISNNSYSFQELIQAKEKTQENNSKNLINFVKKNKNSILSKLGFGTVEIVLIIAVLISLALLFRTAITSYATDLITSVFGDKSILSDNSSED